MTANRDLPARQRSLREHNLAVVMRLVAATPAISRASIAAQSGLTKATVSAIADELISGGLVTEVSPAPRNGAGRPATGVVLTGAKPAGLGMEINVDYLAVCLLDLAGTVRHRAHLTTDQRGRTPAQTWAGLSALAKAASKAAAAEGLVIAGATVALPGLVSGQPAGQEVKIAPNLGWHETPVPPRIDGIAVTAGNEANLAALGELHATGLSSFVYVSGEIGIGAGIVVNGDLFRGTQGWAGELGHVTVDPAGPECSCGSHGCLEQYAGEDAIRSACGPGQDLEQRAHSGDPATLKALDHAGTALGVALSSAVNLLDLPVVVLGSHLAPLVPWLKAPIERELKQRVITSRWSSPEVVPSALGADAAIIGAARTVTEAIIANPAAHLARP